MIGTRDRQGMTLLEVVVALAVGGVALAIGGGTFAALSDRRAAALAEADGDARALAARRSLERWLAEAFVFPDGRGPAFRGVDGTRRTAAGDVADDELSFVTTAPNPTGEDAVELRLFVARNPGAGSGALVAEFSSAPATRRVVLANGVAGLDAHYLTQAFGRREWRDSWASSSLLPGAIELRLTAARGDSLPVMLRLPITVPLANGR